MTTCSPFLFSEEPDYPPGVERTPPIFSRHERVREAAEGLVYAPEEFGVQEGEIEWQPAPEFFAGQTGKYYFDVSVSVKIVISYLNKTNKSFLYYSYI